MAGAFVRGRIALTSERGVVTRLQRGLAGRYAPERELGRGGMAAAYLARDLKHDRRVAIRVLRPEFAAVGATRSRRSPACAAARRIRHWPCGAPFGRASFQGGRR